MTIVVAKMIKPNMIFIFFCMQWSGGVRAVWGAQRVALRGDGRHPRQRGHLGDRGVPLSDQGVPVENLLQVRQRRWASFFG